MEFLSLVSMWIVPATIGLILLHGTWKKVPTYESFVEGGKEGIRIAVSIIPFLVGMLVSISIFRASGAMEFFVESCKPFFSAFGIPAEVLPQALLRPVSGTAALAIMSDLIATYGPDSFIGRLASVIQGSTDTTFYVLTVYFGAVGIKKMGDALKVGLLADAVGIFASILIVILFFGTG
ncbi:MAG: spore maturation protein [Caldibacillus debilis]|jgi:spore maturation protein B|nr:spore maturation protein [Caldibacillus debilis]MBO2482854.1 spore maturation protein [Bacillaceae bacterium]MBY6273350.1 spore maturation protein [Bacillaceae bacterium]OUM89076.1 MAG: spore maturation protein [Caldibacillus debilis]REJ16578.1 MAG: spore maturation protein [Caldibacillus debilis]REJ26951.1 MAG: spore maturation protein [Caldibacillus debilis]